MIAHVIPDWWLEQVDGSVNPEPVVLLDQNEYMAVLHETMLALLNRHDVTELLEVIVRRAAALVGTEHGYIYVLDNNREQMTVQVGIGAFAAQIGYTIQRGAGLAGRVWTSGQPMVVDDYFSWSGSLSNLAQIGFHAVVGVPLTSGEQVVGVIGLAHIKPELRFSPQVLDILARFAEIASVALDNARLYTAAQQELAERRRVEAALLESEARYRAVSELASDFVYSLAVAEDGQLTVEWATGNFPLYPNLRPEHMGIDLWLSTIHPDDLPILAAHTAVMVGGQAVVMEYRMHSPTLGERWVRTHTRSEWDAERRRIVRILGATQDIHEQKLTEQALRESENRYRSIFENAVEGIYQTTLAGRYLAANPKLAEIYGYASPQEMIASVADIATEDYADPERRAAFIRLMAAQDMITEFESQARRKDGSIIWVSENSHTVRDRDGNVLGYEGTVVDITARKQEAYQMHLQATALNASVSPMSITSKQGIIDWVNPAFCALTGYSAAELVGHHTRMLRPHTQDPAPYRQMWDTLTTVHVWRGELVSARKDGSIYTDDVTITPVLDEGGNVSHFITVHHDVTERKKYEEQLTYQARHDHLTGLPNRRVLAAALAEATAAACNGQPAALLFLDLDHFKMVNDNLGHSAGDRLLVELAQILSGQLRADDLLARMGGDEFAILLPNVSSATAEQIATRLCQTVSKATIQLADFSFNPHVSIGVVAINDCDNPEIVLAHADIAMYAAKEQGGNRACLYRSQASPSYL